LEGASNLARLKFEIMGLEILGAAGRGFSWNFLLFFWFGIFGEGRFLGLEFLS
jgi:hypothetical protein